MEPKRIGLAIQTMFADLNQRTHDAAFLHDFPANGSFQTQENKGKVYWYYHGYDRVTGARSAKYVGPDTPEVRQQVQTFKDIKTDHQARADIVSALAKLGFPRTDYFSGRIIDEMGKAGLFRVRAVLVGTMAYQAYPGIVGAVPSGNFMTDDIDFAQDHGISISIGESMEPVLGVLESIDPSFKPVPSLKSKQASKFQNAKGFKVEFLVPNRGSDDYTSELTAMPALGGAAAEPLRYLDYVIQDPVRSTLMHEAGVPVIVPEPSRYAIHKLIVSANRNNREKSPKDLGQAAFLIKALGESGPDLLARSWFNAWKRGQAWREHLKTAHARLDSKSKDIIAGALKQFAHLDEQPDDKKLH